MDVVRATARLAELSQMMTGYVLENFLGLLLSAAVSILHRRSRGGLNAGRTKLFDRCMTVAKRGCRCFYDCAIFFTFSIQVACIVVLARLDFGVSASGMGDSTAKITWAVSLLTIIPLTYVAFNPDLLRGSADEIDSNPKDRLIRDRREQARFLLFVLCWVLFIYPFLSRMMETLGPSMIGGDNSTISNSDWDSVAAVCISNIHSISDSEILAMKVFSVAGSLFVCIPALLKIIWLAINRQHEQSRMVQYIRKEAAALSSLRSNFLIVLFIMIPAIAISQLWTIFRLRNFQKQISQASHNTDIDGEWTFGQIAAVTIYVPVLVECFFAWLYE